MTRYQLAQANIGRFRAPLESPVMEGFRNQLDPIYGPTPHAFTFRTPFPPPGEDTGVEELDATFCDWATHDHPPLA